MEKGWSPRSILCLIIRVGENWYHQPLYEMDMVTKLGTNQALDLVLMTFLAANLMTHLTGEDLCCDHHQL